MTKFSVQLSEGVIQLQPRDHIYLPQKRIFFDVSGEAYLH